MKKQSVRVGQGRPARRMQKYSSNDVGVDAHIDPKRMKNIEVCLGRTRRNYSSCLGCNNYYIIDFSRRVNQSCCAVVMAF